MTRAAGSGCVVVGAGPGGLQAAIAAARAGHDVTVLEREAVPGGQVRLAATVPNRAELGDMVRNQVNECRRLGVTIAYDTPATVGAGAGRCGPTGSSSPPAPSPQRPWWVGPDVTNACDVRDVLTGAAEPAGGVVLIDEIGFHHATSVAELLADRGCAGRGRHAGHGRRAGPRDHARHGGVVDPAGAKGIEQSHRPRADGVRRHAR